MANQMKRSIAKKVLINDLINGDYIKKEGWDPNYILTQEQRKIERVNIIGIIIDKDLEVNELKIDDGSGNIKLKSFDEDNKFLNFEIGDIVLLIGKPREFDDKKFIIPEIIRKIKNKKWIEVRKKELGFSKSKNIKQSSQFKSSQIKETVVEDIKEQKNQKEDIAKEIISKKSKQEGKDNNKDDKIQEEVIEDSSNSEPKNENESIIEIIKKLDKGEGVDIEEVVLQTKIENAEEMINKMILIGEIFEIKPGIVKVLE